MNRLGCIAPQAEYAPRPLLARPGLPRQRLKEGSSFGGAMAPRTSPVDDPTGTPSVSPAAPSPVPEVTKLISTSQFAEVGRLVQAPRPEVPPRLVERGVVVFDLDGTILDDLSLISTVAADV